MGGGLVALGGGGAMAYLAREKYEAYRQDGRERLPPDRSKKDAMNNYAIGSVVLTGVGLAALGTGIGLVLLAPADHQASTQVSVGPGQVFLSGTF